MKRVTSIGGIFFKADDPDTLRDRYRVHLGIECEKEVGAIFNGGERMILPPSSFS
jgi:hypothetical protein